MTPKNHGSVLCLYAETPLHVGAGTSLSAIDLPIARERMSGLPVVPGSGLRGALRELYATGDPNHEKPESKTWALFGPPPQEKKSQPDEDEKQEAQSKRSYDSDKFAGALQVGDARLLLLPLRSARGAWAWATCPMVLQRLNRDLTLLDLAPVPVPSLADEESAALTLVSAVALEGALVVEDLVFKASGHTDVTNLALRLQEFLPQTPEYEPFRKRLLNQLVVLHDTAFRELSERGMEINTRIRLDPETRTVAKGALWTEEALPAESVLWSSLFFDAARSPHLFNKPQSGPLDMEQLLKVRLKEPCMLRLGGDISTGRGLVALRWMGGQS